MISGLSFQASKNGYKVLWWIVACSEVGKEDIQEVPGCHAIIRCLQVGNESDSTTPHPLQSPLEYASTPS